MLLLGGGATVAWFLFDENTAVASTLPTGRELLTPGRELQPPPPGREQPQPPTDRVTLYEEVPDDASALGRVLHSEVGSKGTLAEYVAIGWVVRNRAMARKQSIRRLVCWPQCGRGGDHGVTGSRPFSSRVAARASDIDIARAVIAAPQSEDPTFGAFAALEPELQDKLFREKRPGYNADAEGTRKRWAEKEGIVKYGTVGRWEVFGPRAKPTKPTKATSASGPVTSPSQVPDVKPVGPVTSTSQVS